MQLPPEVQIKNGIRPGSVYYFHEETLTSAEPHYFVVINHEPRSEELILLACSTSQIDKKREFIKSRGLPEETLVEISPADYPDFRKQSAINCNSVFEKDKRYLISKLKDNTLKIKGIINIAIVEKIRAGVLASPLISNKIKKMLITEK